MVIWALGVLLAGMVLLLGLGVVAFATEPTSGPRHRAPMVTDGWANSLGEGWVLHMNGDAELLPARHRAGARHG